MKNIIIVILIALLLSTVTLTTGCWDNTASEQRHDAEQQRTDVFAKAEAMYPAPTVSDFPLRKSLVEYTNRQARINQVYYIYVLSSFGTPIGYYVAKSQPVSTNAFLSSTEDVTERGIATLPSLDGIFYGGSGSSASDGWFFFDAATDAEIILVGLDLFVTDMPLKLEVPRFEVIQQ
jgi:hypothetical protein